MAPSVATGQEMSGRNTLASPATATTVNTTAITALRLTRAHDIASSVDPDVICWNDSKGSSIGLDADRRLCERITAATGKPVTTSSLAILEAFAMTGVRRFGLVTPYASGYASRTRHTSTHSVIPVLPRHMRDSAIICPTGRSQTQKSLPRCEPSRRSGRTRSSSIAPTSPGAHLVADWKQALASVSACAWKCLRLIVEPTSAGGRWGNLFTDKRFG